MIGLLAVIIAVSLLVLAFEVTILVLFGLSVAWCAYAAVTELAKRLTR